MENKWSLKYFLVIVLIFNLQTKIELRSVREISENENSPNDQTNTSLKTQNNNSDSNAEQNIKNLVTVAPSNPIPVNVQINSTALQVKKNDTEINAPQLNHNNSNSNISNGAYNNSSSTTTTTTTTFLSINSSSPVNTNTSSISTTTTANITTTSSLDKQITTTKINEINGQKEENKEDPNDGNKDGQKEENKEDPNDGNKDDENDEKDDANDEKNQLNEQDFDDFANKEKNDNMQPPVKFVDIKNNPPDSNKFPYDYDDESSSGFLTYFLVISGICIAAYVVYHNKAKVLGLIIEGRNHTNRRRFNSRVYTRIENVQDAMPNAN